MRLSPALPGPQYIPTLPCVFFTAGYGFQMAGLKEGETAPIHAAGSGVDTAGIQMAKALRARVLTSAGSAVPSDFQGEVVA